MLRRRSEDMLVLPGTPVAPKAILPTRCRLSSAQILCQYRVRIIFFIRVFASDLHPIFATALILWLGEENPFSRFLEGRIFLIYNNRAVHFLSLEQEKTLTFHFALDKWDSKCHKLSLSQRRTPPICDHTAFTPARYRLSIGSSRVRLHYDFILRFPSTRR